MTWQLTCKTLLLVRNLTLNKTLDIGRSAEAAYLKTKDIEKQTEANVHIVSKSHPKTLDKSEKPSHQKSEWPATHILNCCTILWQVAGWELYCSNSTLVYFWVRTVQLSAREVAHKKKGVSCMETRVQKLPWEESLHTLMSKEKGQEKNPLCGHFWFFECWIHMSHWISEHLPCHPTKAVSLLRCSSTTNPSSQLPLDVSDAKTPF